MIKLSYRCPDFTIKLPLIKLTFCILFCLVLQNKNFKFKEVEKANSEGYYCAVTLNCGFDYYITFKTEDASTAAIETFQALVHDGETVREVKSIRVKPTNVTN